MKIWLLSAIVVSALTGCSKASVPVTPAVPAPGTPPSTSGSSASSKPSEQPALPLSMVPAGLKNDAYAYEGLGSEAVQNIQFNITGREPFVGTSQYKLVKIEKGNAIFHYLQSGGPDVDEVNTMSLEPSGIYTETSSPMELKTPHVIELPAKLSPGTTWKSHTVISSQGQDITIDSTYKVVGTQTVKTPAGTFNALYLVGDGKGKAGKDPVTVKEQRWYAKGVGAVKQLLEMNRAGVHYTISQELKK